MNILLSGVISQRFPAELEARRSEVAEESLSESASRGAHTGSLLPSEGVYPAIGLKRRLPESEIAIFPGLVISVPCTEAIRAAVDSASRTGSQRVCVFQASELREGGVGVVAQVLHVTEDVQIFKCLERCKILHVQRQVNDNPPDLEPQPHIANDFPMTRILILSDSAEPDSLVQCGRLCEEISSLLEVQLSAIGSAGRLLFRDTYGAAPSNFARFTAPEFERFSLWLGTVLDTRGLWPLMLKTTSTLERLRMSRDLMLRAGSGCVLRVASDRSWLRLRSGLGGLFGLLIVLLALWLKGRGVI